ncbi:hypothetical protein ACINK0_11290 [Deinococcus sp. VB343]|uniref:hypothetical protein n=1 Tax=Deinococcus sp. VB343 TaxID=3385567 RepID=UPI0039C902D0
MTASKKLVLAMPFFDGLQWQRGVGEVFDTSKLDEKVAEKLEAKGYLVTEQVYRARLNPEAARIQEAAEASQGELQSIYALFPGVTTTEGVKAAVGALQAKVPSAEDMEKVSSARTFARQLGQLYPDAKTPDDLLTAVRQAQGESASLREKLKVAEADLSAAQASAAKPEDVQALAEYRSLVGDLLPEGLAPTAVKALKAKGYVTRGVVSRIPRADLDAVSGVGPEALKLLDGWAPYVGAQAPAPAQE